VAAIYKSDEGRHAVQSQYRRVLERWPVVCEQRVVPTREGETFIITSGDPFTSSSEATMPCWILGKPASEWSGSSGTPA